MLVFHARFLCFLPFSVSQVFDRASFGVGLLSSNRYNPPENVGDEPPSRTGPHGEVVSNLAPMQEARQPVTLNGEVSKAEGA